MTAGNDFSLSMLDTISRCGVIPVVTIGDADNAVPLAKALLACGIDVMEIALRSEAAVDSIRCVVDQVPEMLVGAGTVLRVDQVAAVVDAGAAFAVSPGLSEAVVREAQSCGLPFAPGVITPSEVARAVDLGCRQLKLFPIEPVGGIAYMKAMIEPYQHLGLKYFASGGIHAANAAAYLYRKDVVGVAAAWIAPPDLIAAKNWSAVIDHAIEAVGVVKELRAG